MKENGWVKLHRRMLDNPIMGNANYLQLWIILLLKANHAPKKLFMNNTFVVIREGQLVTGRDELSRTSHLAPSTIERILKYLENEHQILQEKTTKYRVITILNWKEYQARNAKVDNKRTTNGQQTRQQTDTNKKYKKVKNDKKDNAGASPAVPFSLEEYFKKMETDKRRHINVIQHYLEEKKLTFGTEQEVSAAIKRHSRAAIEVAKFTDEKIVKATNEAKKEYPELWTVETILKILTR